MKNKKTFPQNDDFRFMLARLKLAYSLIWGAHQIWGNVDDVFL